MEVSPNQAYVINYLAYSWIEQGVKIEKSLASSVNAAKEMILISSAGEQEEEQAQILGLALEEVANYLSDATWSFQQFSNVFQDIQKSKNTL